MNTQLKLGQNIFEKKNKIYHGDCLEAMKQIPDKYIDHIICDCHFTKLLKIIGDFINSFSHETSNED